MVKKYETISEMVEATKIERNKTTDQHMDDLLLSLTDEEREILREKLNGDE